MDVNSGSFWLTSPDFSTQPESRERISSSAVGAAESIGTISMRIYRSEPYYSVLVIGPDLRNARRLDLYKTAPFFPLPSLVRTGEPWPIKDLRIFP